MGRIVKSIYRLQKIIIFIILLVSIQQKKDTAVIVCAIFFARTDLLEILDCDKLDDK